MYSLNVPVPSSVTALAHELAADLPRARQRTRGEHTLVVKRLGGDGRDSYARIEARVRDCLRGQPPFELRVTGVEQFETAVTGPSPVVYLAVESPGLRELHERLVAEFGAVEDLEGEAYVPHVTVARGGDPAAARRLVERDIEPRQWTVDTLRFYDADRSAWVTELSLPA